MTCLFLFLALSNLSKTVLKLTHKNWEEKNNLTVISDFTRFLYKLLKDEKTRYFDKNQCYCYRVKGQ